jgi:hypothetical protein
MNITNTSITSIPSSTEKSTNIATNTNTNTNNNKKENTIGFDDVLSELITEEPIPAPLVNEKTALENGANKTSFEITHLSATFYHYGAEYIDSKNPESIKKGEFAITSLHIMVENYGSSDALESMTDLFDMVEKTSPLIANLLEHFSNLLKSDKLPLKGVSNKVSVNEVGDKVLSSLKEQLHQFSLRLTDIFKRDSLASLFEDGAVDTVVEEELIEEFINSETVEESEESTEIEVVELPELNDVLSD